MSKKKSGFSIDQMIKALQRIKEKSPFGGQTQVELWALDSGLDYFEIEGVKLVQDDNGAVVSIRFKGLEEADTVVLKRRIINLDAFAEASYIGDSTYSFNKDTLREMSQKLGRKVTAREFVHPLASMPPSVKARHRASAQAILEALGLEAFAR